MTKLYLRAGHGGDHIGTSGYGLVEKEENLRHILSIAEKLAVYDVELKLARTEDVTVNLSQSIGEANIWRADLYYSGHHNGFHDSRAYGYDSHIYTYPSEESIRAQDTIHPLQAAVWVKWGSRDRGQKRSNFAELRETEVPSILIENGFMTNPDDNELLKNPAFLEEFDQATVRGFVELFNLKLKEDTGVKAETYIVKQGDNMYRIARNNDLTLDELAKLNPHIDDTSQIEVGDIIFLTQPTDFEIEFAEMNRELILCKKKVEEYEETGQQINTLSKKYL
ncbi:MAG: N-acetylmuramoyl-L-alanine amidase [Bacillota bacterium]|nr:N-acetylmuramoyl-L-alanine amidase [Bacillota bacterium]MDW7682632.1 N-acetylmuramoyl-L-alanine amidase [Bacillota bacterium]